MGLPTVGSPLLWIGFLAFVVVMLALDLGVFHRKAHAVSMKEAATWSIVWIALALLFNLWVWHEWGTETAGAFLTGYVIEKALSVDNLFVFYVIFAGFAVKPAYQHHLLFWGIVGALVLRAAMVWGGVALLTMFHWAIYVFGFALIATGGKMLARPDEQPHPEKSRVFRLMKRVIPTASGDHGVYLWVRENGRWKGTSLLLVLILIELSDVVFALDSILAIFAITTDPFIVFTSNVFAVMGLRSLFFVLANVARRFEYLQPGLALVLIFVGVKMAISEWFKIPVAISLLVVSLLIGGSIVASVVKSRRQRIREQREQSVGSRHGSKA